MGWFVAIFAALAGLLIGKAKASSRTSLKDSGGGMDPEYPTAVWSPLVASLIATEFPRINLGVAMKWLDSESGGNPCDIGENIFDSNGNPQEIGIGQLYNPDDFNHLKINPSQFRVYCTPGTKHRIPGRKLTADEMTAQVRYTLLAKMNEGVDKANQVVMAYSLDWSQPDYWKLVKAPHALPGILNTGMPAVVKKLGRSPSNWSEFRTVLGMDNEVVRQKAIANPHSLDSHEKVIWQWMRGLDACEKCGNGYVGPSIA